MELLSVRSLKQNFPSAPQKWFRGPVTVIDRLGNCRFSYERFIYYHSHSFVRFWVSQGRVGLNLYLSYINCAPLGEYYDHTGRRTHLVSSRSGFRLDAWSKILGHFTIDLA